MINNRQAGRRNNRGRDNRRPSGNNRGSGENGNRIDNRARGNAPQLLEKYKNLARDAQLAGDRVSAEYYLQFADHYFRVLADNRQRQEEQQARYRQNFDEDGEAEGNFEANAEFAEGVEGEPASEQGFEQRNRRDGNRNRQDRPERQERQERRPRAPDESSASGNEAEQTDQPVAAQDGEDRSQNRARRGDRVRAPRRTEERAAPEESGLDLAVLPPAIGRADNDTVAEAEEAPAPVRKRAPRKPRTTEAEAAE